MRHRQQGMSVITILLLIGVAGLLAKLALAVVPAYLDFMTLDKTIKAMFRETAVDSQSVDNVKQSLLNRFQINNIPDKTLDDMVISKEGNKTTIVVDYDARQNLISNIDVVVHFQHTYTSDKEPGVQ